MGRAPSMRPSPSCVPTVAPPSFIHLGNCPNLAQFVAGSIVGSGGTNAAFAAASAASGGPCRLGTRASRDGQCHRESANPSNGPGEFPGSINRVRTYPGVVAIDTII